MSQRLPRRPAVVLAAVLSIALGLATQAALNGPAGADRAPYPAPYPAPTLTRTATPTPQPSDPCDPDGTVSVGDFVMWDGATVFTRQGAKVNQVVNVNFEDGPVLKLNVPAVGEVASAKPVVMLKVNGAPIAEPRPVVLPPAQAQLAL